MSETCGARNPQGEHVCEGKKGHTQQWHSCSIEGGGGIRVWTNDPPPDPFMWANASLVTPPESCASCRFFLPVNDATLGYGHCHRRAPVIFHTLEGKTWPYLHRKNWCGEYEVKP